LSYQQVDNLTVTTHRIPLAALLSLATALALAQPPTFDLQGHRGARGLMPENTLPAFQKALDLGVDTLECDMAITRDGVVVVHHDLHLNPDTTRGPDGQWLAVRGPAIAELSYAELQRYDVGRIKPGTEYAKAYPEQQAVDGTRVPRLTDLFDLVRKSGNTRVGFDCETKVSPLEPTATLPPAEFTRRVIEEVRRAGMQGRFTIQSFDWRTLQQVQKDAPEIRTLYLSSPRTLARAPDGGPSPWLAGFDADQHGASVPRAVHAAGGRLWAPNQTYLTQALREEARALGVAVIPWTVNEPAMISKLLDMRVDGLITDRPDLVQLELRKRAASPR
jgi:glycerophosphoryl diester phosphodiesterase